MRWVIHAQRKATADVDNPDAAVGPAHISASPPSSGAARPSRRLTVLVNNERCSLPTPVARWKARSRHHRGLASRRSAPPVQEAFVKHLGFQCGYCTPA